MTHSYSVAGVNSDGCLDTAFIKIRVNSCAGLEDRSLRTVSIYPNPNSGHFMISSAEPVKLFVFNEMGQLIGRYHLNAENKFTANVSGLAKGVYFITGNDENLRYARKIVVTD